MTGGAGAAAHSGGVAFARGADGARGRAVPAADGRRAAALSRLPDAVRKAQADGAAYARLCHAPDGFDRTMRGIRLLRERGIDVRVGASVTRENRKDVARITEIARECGAAMNVDPYMTPAVRERTKPFEQQARREGGCAAPGGGHELPGRTMQLRGKLAGADAPVRDAGKTRHAGV